jgi:hypothetical protein
VAVDWTTDRLIERVRERANVPDAGAPGDSHILDVATIELHTRITPFLRSIREGYGLKTTTQALTVGTADYRIPSDAQGDTIHSLVLVKSDGTERNLTRLEVQDDEHASTNGRVRGYCLIGSKIRLLPAPDTADTLRILYYRRMSELVPTDECIEVPFASDADGEIQIYYSDYDTIDADTEVDIVRGVPAFDLLSDGGTYTATRALQAVTITNITIAPTIIISAVLDWTPQVGDQLIQGAYSSRVTTVFSTVAFQVADITGFTVAVASVYHTTAVVDPVDDSAETAVGDFVCLHMQTCVPQIPAELHAALVSATAAQLLAEDGDAQGAAIESANAARIMDAARMVLSPRADGSPRVLVTRNSPTRNRRRRQAGWDSTG